MAEKSPNPLGLVPNVKRDLTGLPTQDKIDKGEIPLPS
jgi:hypothetical protein